MKNLKKAAAITMITGGLVAAGAGIASATPGAHAHGAATNSPGVASGNAVQVPVHVPVNVSGNSINVIGLLNPAFANAAVNG
ncbi:chaplin [Streptomyces sp. NPDC017979]|uniref:chaplin n=1 Tax=unclassified Streptomyces TaxID=2593676 RepID=UPI00340D9CA4